MDFDWARDRLMKDPTDPDTITNVVLELLGVVAALDNDLAIERQKRQEMEQTVAAMQDQFRRHGHDHFTGAVTKRF